MSHCASELGRYLPGEFTRHCAVSMRPPLGCSLQGSPASSTRGPIMDRAADTACDIPPGQLVRDSDVDSAPSAGVAAAFSRWWLGRLGAISDDLVKRPAGEIRQLMLHSLDVFPQRVGR
jgi:hypothetical protein